MTGLFMDLMVSDLDDAAWLRRFAELVGSNAEIPAELPPPLADGARAVRVQGLPSP